MPQMPLHSYSLTYNLKSSFCGNPHTRVLSSSWQGGGARASAAGELLVALPLWAGSGQLQAPGSFTSSFYSLGSDTALGMPCPESSEGHRPGTVARVQGSGRVQQQRGCREAARLGPSATWVPPRTGSCSPELLSSAPGSPW